MFFAWSLWIVFATSTPNPDLFRVHIKIKNKNNIKITASSGWFGFLDSQNIENINLWTRHETRGWIPQNIINEKWMLINLMAWCRQATSNYLGQCWSISMASYGVTRTQWVYPYNTIYTILLRILQKFIPVMPYFTAMINVHAINQSPWERRLDNELMWIYIQ